MVLRKIRYFGTDGEIFLLMKRGLQSENADRLSAKLHDYIHRLIKCEVLNVDEVSDAYYCGYLVAIETEWMGESRIIELLSDILSLILPYIIVRRQLGILGKSVPQIYQLLPATLKETVKTVLLCNKRCFHIPKSVVNEHILPLLGGSIDLFWKNIKIILHILAKLQKIVDNFTHVDEIPVYRSNTNDYAVLSLKSIENMIFDIYINNEEGF